MGPVSDSDAPLPDRLALDTNCFIYFIQDPTGNRGEWLRRAVFETAGPSSLVASTTALAELLVGPERRGRPADARALRDALVSLPRMRWVELDVRIAERAAQLRGRHGIRLADAVQLATAGLHADALLTNDRRVVQDDHGVPVIILDDQV